MENFSKKIEISYINFISSHKRRPNELSEFIDKELINEESITYNSEKELNALETSIWINSIEIAFNNAASDPNYLEYGAREKTLSFFYNLIEILKSQKEFFVFSSNIHSPFELKMVDDRSTAIKNVFLSHFNTIINEAIETGEIESRMFISDYYGNLIFAQAVLVIKYWANDTSDEAENTDEIIEKSVNLIMDLMAPNFADSAVSLVKFLFQK
ncbi:hypothetical protein [Flammeovirga kamogawensis]|uniref:Tetracyclin repressor-like C-terminal domain-containing protein n=1 Tax=Flammeovirga kamogawensis TaxID=373891 RepID=A0ABX8GWF7_9BACT|nr:hypothetical protein [Flammeovirga kamogawensis]MBB6461090.1 hypothetical protein [Flammeovirga kamogawensis]QWG07658.1 hypothetical protein KM029_01605 [Flammeovirga kamogawensis]TRX69468.1 hypothetical protein EO216_15545 [Flammeovirga kamogawensis]